MTNGLNQRLIQFSFKIHLRQTPRSSLALSDSLPESIRISVSWRPHWCSPLTIANAKYRNGFPHYVHISIPLTLSTATAAFSSTSSSPPPSSTHLGFSFEIHLDLDSRYAIYIFHAYFSILIIIGTMINMTHAITSGPRLPLAGGANLLDGHWE